MTNLTLADFIENNLGPGAEIFQEVAVKLHSYLSGANMEGSIRHKLWAISDFKHSNEKHAHEYQLALHVGVSGSNTHL